MADRSARVTEIEITPEMVAAGEDALLGRLGGAVSVHWDPRDLAIEVFRAMADASQPVESSPK